MKKLQKKKFVLQGNELFANLMSRSALGNCDESLGAIDDRNYCYLLHSMSVFFKQSKSLFYQSDCHGNSY